MLGVCGHGRSHAGTTHGENSEQFLVYAFNVMIHMGWEAILVVINLYLEKEI